MSHVHFWIAAAIIAFVVGISFLFSVPHTSDSTIPQTEKETESYPVVSLRDSFKKGVHIITGSLEAKDACSSISARTAISGSASTTGKIIVEITLSDEKDVCLQLPTTMNFSTTISAPANLPISVIVNGREASTTIL